MKKIYIISCIFLISFLFPAKAQVIGNDWINYTQSYYKFPITKTGIYRITPPALAASGFPINAIDPRNFQIYGRGKLVPIYEKG